MAAAFAFSITECDTCLNPSSSYPSSWLKLTLFITAPLPVMRSTHTSPSCAPYSRHNWSKTSAYDAAAAGTYSADPPPPMNAAARTCIHLGISFTPVSLHTNQCLSASVSLPGRVYLLTKLTISSCFREKDSSASIFTSIPVAAEIRIALPLPLSDTTAAAAAASLRPRINSRSF